MVSRFYRDRLQQVLASAQDDDVASASNNWHYYASWIDTVSEGIRKNGQNLASEIEGQSGGGDGREVQDHRRPSWTPSPRT